MIKISNKCCADVTEGFSTLIIVGLALGVIGILCLKVLEFAFKGIQAQASVRLAELESGTIIYYLYQLFTLNNLFEVLFVTVFVIIVFSVCVNLIRKYAKTTK